MKTKAEEVAFVFGQASSRLLKHERPWGYFEILATGPGYKVKRLVVNPGKRTSLQWHELRDELWTYVSGESKKIRVGDGTWRAFLGCSDTVKAKEIHRITNTGTEPLIIIEVQTSDDSDGCREEDIHRIEDDFGREVE